MHCFSSKYFASKTRHHNKLRHSDTNEDLKHLYKQFGSHVSRSRIMGQFVSYVSRGLCKPGLAYFSCIHSPTISFQESRLGFLSLGFLLLLILILIVLLLLLLLLLLSSSSSSSSLLLTNTRGSNARKRLPSK